MLFLFAIVACEQQSTNLPNKSEISAKLETQSNLIAGRDEEDENDSTLPPELVPPVSSTPPEVTPAPIASPPAPVPSPPPPVATAPPSPVVAPPPIPPPVATVPPIMAPPPAPVNQPVPPSSNPNDILISLVEINDLHAHMTAHADYTKTGGLVVRGGLARLATVLTSIKTENPNTVVMNIGDTYHGGVETFFTEGNAMVDPVNSLGIDVGVPGNWDFAYGPAVTRQRFSNDGVFFNPGGQVIKKPNFPYIAANVTNVAPAPRVGETFLSPTFVTTVAGVTIGFIGITSDIVPLMHSTLSTGFEFTQGLMAYANIIARQANMLHNHDGAQIVVVMSELGIHKNIVIADNLGPGLVDIIFSSHTHEMVTNPILSSNGTMIVEAGNDTFIGRMDITFNGNTIMNRQWNLIPIEHSVNEDVIVKAIVDRERAPFLDPAVNMTPIGSSSLLVAQPLTQPINTVLGKTDTFLDRRHAVENSFNTLFASIMQQTSGTQIGLSPGFRFDSVNPSQNALFEDNTIATGDITLEDVYRFFPTPFTVSTATITGARMKEMVEENLTRVFSINAFNHQGGWVDGFQGLDISANLAAADGRRVNDIYLSGSAIPIADGDILTIAGCQKPFELGTAVMCGYDGFIDAMPLSNPATNSSWTAIDIFVHGVQNNMLSSVPRSYFVDTNSTMFWPHVEYIQPLYGVM